VTAVTAPIKAAMNRRSKRKFDEFWFALQTVGDALMEAEQLAAKLRDQYRRHGGGNSGKSGKSASNSGTGRGGARASNGINGRLVWSAASPDELRAAAAKAHNSLRIMATTAKRWEAELTSREWR
jgi:hypothetical protein